MFTVILPPLVCILIKLKGGLLGWFFFDFNLTNIYWLDFVRVAIGYDEGAIMIKIGREEPVASLDSSGKIIWAKNAEIQTVNIRAVGGDFEVS